MRKVQLKAKDAKSARVEAASIEPERPKKLLGFDLNDQVTYISLVRERGNKAYVATAMKGDDKKKYSRFEIEF